MAAACCVGALEFCDGRRETGARAKRPRHDDDADASDDSLVVVSATRARAPVQRRPFAFMYVDDEHGAVRGIASTRKQACARMTELELGTVLEQSLNDAEIEYLVAAAMLADLDSFIDGCRTVLVAGSARAQVADELRAAAPALKLESWTCALRTGARGARHCSWSKQVSSDI